MADRAELSTYREWLEAYALAHPWEPQRGPLMGQADAPLREEEIAPLRAVLETASNSGTVDPTVVEKLRLAHAYLVTRMGGLLGIAVPHASQVLAPTANDEPALHVLRFATIERHLHFDLPGKSKKIGQADFWVLNFGGIRVYDFRQATNHGSGVIRPDQVAHLLSFIDERQSLITTEAGFEAFEAITREVDLSSDQNSTDPLHDKLGYKSQFTFPEDHGASFEGDLRESAIYFQGSKTTLYEAGYREGIMDSPTRYEAYPLGTDVGSFVVAGEAPVPRQTLTLHNSTIYTLASPRIAGHVRVDVQGKSERLLIDYWLLDFSGVLVCVEKYGKHVTPRFVWPEERDKYLSLISPTEDEKVISTGEEYLSFEQMTGTGRSASFQNVEANPTYRRLMRFTYPDIPEAPNQTFEENLARATFNALDNPGSLSLIGTGFLIDAGYHPTEGSAPLERPYYEHPLPFAGVQAQLPFAVYSLHGAECISHVTIRLSQMPKKKATDFYLLNFSGILVVVTVMTNKEIEFGIVDPAYADKVKAFFVEKGKEWDLVKNKQYDVLFELLKPAFINNPANTNPLYETRVKTHFLINANDWSDPTIPVDAKCQSSWLHILNDYDLLADLGYRYQSGSDTRYNVNRRSYYLPFPAFDTELKAQAGLHPAGSYTFRGGEELARFGYVSEGEKRTISFYNFSGIIMSVSRKANGEIIIAKMGHYEEGGLIRDALQFLKGDSPNGHADELSKAEFIYLQDMIGQYFYQRSLPALLGQAEKPVYGLDHFIEARMSIQFDKNLPASAGEPVLTIQNEGPLLEHLGYDHEHYPDQSVVFKKPLPLPVGRMGIGKVDEPGDLTPLTVNHPRFLYQVTFGEYSGLGESSLPETNYRFFVFGETLVVVASPSENPDLRTVYLVKGINRTPFTELFFLWTPKVVQQGEGNLILSDPATVGTLRESLAKILEEGSTVLERKGKVVAGAPALLQKDSSALTFQNPRNAEVRFGLDIAKGLRTWKMFNPEFSGIVRLTEGKDSGDYRLARFGAFVFVVFALKDGQVGAQFLHSEKDKRELSSLFPTDRQAIDDLSGDRQGDFKSVLDVVRDRHPATTFDYNPREGTILFSREGSEYQMSLLALRRKPRHWENINLVIPRGLPSAQSLKVVSHDAPILQRVPGVLSPNNQSLAPIPGADYGPVVPDYTELVFYKIDFSGITVVLNHISLITGGEKWQAYFPNAVWGDRLRPCFEKGTKISGVAFQDIANQMLASTDFRGGTIYNPQLGEEIVDETHGFHLVVPARLQHEAVATWLSRFQMQIYKDTSALAGTGYSSPIKDEVGYQTHFFEPVAEFEGGTLYRLGESPLGESYLGNLAVTYHDVSRELRFYNLADSAGLLRPNASIDPLHFPAPVLTRKREGRKFVSVGEDSLPDLQIDIRSWPHPGQSFMEGTVVRLPLTEAMTRVLGVPHEENYLLTPYVSSPVYAEGTFDRYYDAGPFLIGETEGATGGARRFFAGYASAGSAPAKFIMLVPKTGAEDHEFVPFATIDSTRRERVLTEARRIKADTSFYQEQAALTGAKGLMLVTAFDRGNGAVLRMVPHDGLMGVLTGQPANDRVVVLPTPADIKLEPVMVTDHVSREVEAVDAEFDAANSHGFGVDIAIHRTAPRAGTLIPLVIPGTKNSLGYELILPVTGADELRAGQVVSCDYQGGRTSYILQPRRGRGWSLMQEGERVGVLDWSNDRIDLSVGDHFQVSGALPQVTVVDNVTLSGHEGERQLQTLLDFWRDDQADSEADPFPNFFIRWSSPTDWTVTVNARNEGTATSGEIVRFLQVALEAQTYWAGRKGASEPHTTLEQAADDWHNHVTLQAEPTYAGGDFALSAATNTQGPEARLTRMTLNWQGQDILLPLNNTHHWVWEDDREKTFTWKGIRSPSSISQVEITRDTTVTFNRIGIPSASWVENRVYHKSPGHVVPVSMDMNDARWGQIIDVREKGRHYRLTLNRVPQITDCTDNLIRVSELTIPATGGQVCVTWEPEGTSAHVYSVESLVNGRSIGQKGESMMVSGGSFGFRQSQNLSGIGTISDRVTVSFDGTDFSARGIVALRQQDDLRWVEEPTERGVVIQRAVLTQGGKSYDAGKEFQLSLGESRNITFRVGEETMEYRLTCATNGRVTPHRLGKALASLASGFTADPSRTSFPRVYPVAGTTTEEVPYSFDPSRIQHVGSVVDQLQTLGPRTIFYPTLQTVQSMIDVVRASYGVSLDVDARTRRLRFVADEAPVWFEQDFIYDPIAGNWLPAGLNGRREGDNLVSFWNGTEHPHPTIYRRLTDDTAEIIPIPPGRHFYLSRVPGKAGLLVAYTPGTGEKESVNARADRAIHRFHQYLATQDLSVAQGAKGDSPSGRFMGEAQWTLEADGMTASCTLLEETMTSDGLNRTGRALIFTALVDTTTGELIFDHGRTTLTVRRGDAVELEGDFELRHDAATNRFVFVPLHVTVGDEETAFRAFFLPDANPVLVPVPLASLAHDAEVSHDWIYAQNWIGRERVRAVKPGSGKPTPSPTNGAGSAPSSILRPLQIVGDLPEAPAELLPYRVNEDEWGALDTVVWKSGNGTTTAAEEVQRFIKILGSWLSKEGGDFSLLVPSIKALEEAKERVAQLQAAQPDVAAGGVAAFKRALVDFPPVRIWLINTNQVRMEVSLVPTLPNGNTNPVWSVYSAGNRAQGTSLRLVGEDPEQKGKLVQLFASAVTSTAAGEQILKIFDPTPGASGVIQTLKLMGLSEEGSPLVSFFDATHRPRPEDPREALRWKSQERRKVEAEERLYELARLLRKADDHFVPVDDKSVAVSEDGSTTWTLHEHEKKGSGEYTGKVLEIKGIRTLAVENGTTPLEVPQQLLVRSRDALSKKSDKWEEGTYTVYQTGPRKFLLVDVVDPSRRYSLKLEPTEGNISWRPVVSTVRGFETGLDAFYSPPQWEIDYNVARLRAEETLGLARAQDVTADYQERKLPEGHRVHRYYFYVDEIKTVTHFDLEMDEHQSIIRVFDDSWGIEGKNLESRDYLASQVVSNLAGITGDSLSLADPLVEGDERVYLRYQPPYNPKSGATAVGNTQYLAIDFRKGDPLTVTRFRFHHLSNDPRQIFLPHELENPFDYAWAGGGGGKIREGYWMSETKEHTVEEKLAGRPPSQQIKIYFYHADNAQRRRSLEFVLERNGDSPSPDGSLRGVQEASFKLTDFHTGEVLVNQGNATFQRAKGEDPHRYVLTHPRGKIVLSVTPEGTLPKGITTPFEYEEWDEARALLPVTQVGQAKSADASKAEKVKTAFATYIIEAEKRGSSEVAALKKFDRGNMGRSTFGMLLREIISYVTAELVRETGESEGQKKADRFIDRALEIGKQSFDAKDAKNEKALHLLSEVFIAVLVSQQSRTTPWEAQSDLINMALNMAMRNDLDSLVVYHGIALLAARVDGYPLAYSLSTASRIRNIKPDAKIPKQEVAENAARMILWREQVVTAGRDTAILKWMENHGFFGDWKEYVIKKPSAATEEVSAHSAPEEEISPFYPASLIAQMQVRKLGKLAKQHAPVIHQMNPHQLERLHHLVEGGSHHHDVAHFLIEAHAHQTSEAATMAAETAAADLTAETIVTEII